MEYAKDQPTQIPMHLMRALERADPSWHAILGKALALMLERDPDYLATLREDAFLPNGGRIFAAFSQPLEEIKYVLVGEGPYPRAESANGYCFMDAAVGDIWSDVAGAGLSKAVNRATSLRNFLKMLLVARGDLCAENTGAEALASIAALAREAQSNTIQSLGELQENLLSHGFLLLNASLVFRAEVSPARDAAAWVVLLEQVFSALVKASEQREISLILWGKVADQLMKIPSVAQLRTQSSEHPYNLSFIQNKTMQKLFGPLKLMDRG